MTDRICYYMLFFNIAFIYDLIEDFMKYNPPCEECLVQSICIEEIHRDNYPPVMLKIIMCDSLLRFIENTDLFHVNTERLEVKES